MLSVTRFSALGAVREKLLYGRNCCNSTVRLWSDYLWKFVNMVVKFSCKSPNNLQLSFTSGLCSHLLVIRGARTTFFIGRAGSSPPFLSHFPSLISPFPPHPLEVGHLVPLFLPSHSLLSVPSTPMPYLSSPFPLEVPGPWNLTRKSGGSAVSSPSRVWGRAPAEITFGAFWLHPVAAVSVIFVRINLPKFNFGKLNENHKYWQSKTYSLPYQSHSWQGNCPPAHYVPGPLFAVCRIGNATAECIVCKKNVGCHCYRGDTILFRASEVAILPGYVQPACFVVNNVVATSKTEQIPRVADELFASKCTLYETHFITYKLYLFSWAPLAADGQNAWNS